MFLVPVRGNLANLKCIYALNSVGAFIWGRLDGRTGIDAIAADVVANFQVDSATALRDAGDLVSLLSTQGLLEESA